MSADVNQPEPLVTVTGLDHIGLRVRDVESSLSFYTGVLGLESERVKEWRNGEVTFPSVRLNSSTLIDLFAAPRRSRVYGHQSGPFLSGNKTDRFGTLEIKVYEIGDWHPRRAGNTLGITRKW